MFQTFGITRKLFPFWTIYGIYIFVRKPYAEISTSLAKRNSQLKALEWYISPPPHLYYLSKKRSIHSTNQPLHPRQMMTQEVTTPDIPTEAMDIPCSWNEDADTPEPSSWKKEDLLQRMMHGRLLNRQIRRARHVPGIFYAPAVLAGW
jgi:hypothetical protein